VKHLSGAPFLGRLLELPTNIRLGWKSLPGTSTQAFCENLYFKVVKSVITLGFSVNLIKLFILAL
jgi:hypothetical protein